MNNRIQILPFILTIIFSALFIVITGLVLFTIRKPQPQKNTLLIVNDEINEFLYNNDNNDFNALIDLLQSDSEHEKFINLTLTHVKENYASFEGYETRYPKYQEFLDMEVEMKREDTSEWIAGVIKGNINTSFENSVWTFLAKFEKNYYLNQVIDRFFRVSNDVFESGNEKIPELAALLLYIERFPENRELQRRVQQNRNMIIRLSEMDNLDPNIYYYLRTKYIGLRDYIVQKISAIRGRTYGALGEVPDMNELDIIIKEFKSRGRGMPQNFYPLFDLGFSNDRLNTFYIYIALEVFKDIGFEDKVLTDWLSRNYANFKMTIYSSDEQIWEAERQERVRLERELRNAGLGDVIEAWKNPAEKSLYTSFLRETPNGQQIIDILNHITAPPLRRSIPQLGSGFALPAKSINFPQMADETRNVIKGRSASFYSQTLENLTSFIIRDMSHNVITKEIDNEFPIDYFNQYTDYDINKAQDDYNMLCLNALKINNDLFKIILILCSIAALIFCIYTSVIAGGYSEAAGNLLAWLPLPIIGIITFLLARPENLKYGSVSGNITFFVISGIVLIFLTIKTRLLRKLSVKFYGMVLDLSARIQR